MSNSLRHQERRRRRAKQKTKEGRYGGGIQRLQSAYKANVSGSGTAFMSKLGALLFRLRRFRGRRDNG